MLFDSSIRKELARSFGATAVVLITVVMTMMLIRTLGQASRGSVNPQDVMLVMGYTGAKAMRFKELYIRRFNEMESFIKTLVSARQEFPLLTSNIKLLHENPKPYHFSNECDMLNRIVVGMTAKQFRTANGIEKGKSISPYLSDEQITMLDTLQKVDVGLLVAVPDYEQRKRHLEWYKLKMEEKE